VTAAAIVNSTVIAAARPSPEMKPIRSTSIPNRAMHTVVPANRTARPEVFSARTAASRGDIPALRLLRCRVTMNSA
jgi:hypothetical protein